MSFLHIMALGLLAVSPDGESANPAMAAARTPTTASVDLSAVTTSSSLDHDQLATRAVRGTSSAIFIDGFETVGSSWSSTVGMTWSGSGTIPNIDFNSCALPPGEYTLKVSADNSAGGHDLEYPLTIIDFPCVLNPLETCRSLVFGSPLSFFR